MDSNTHSTQPSGPPPGGPPPRLASLTAAVEELAAQDLDRLADAALAAQVLELRRLLDRLDRNRLHLGAGTAASAVRTARALFRGPLTATAQAVCNGELSVAHAQVLAAGTHPLPDQVTVEAEPVLVEAARRLDPPRLRRLLGHLLQLADPNSADRDRERRHARRGLWLAPTFEGMVAVDGLLEPEAGQTLLAALEPLARPAAPGRWGPPPADGDRGPGQPPRPPRGGGWRDRLGRTAGPRGLPATRL